MSEPSRPPLIPKQRTRLDDILERRPSKFGELDPDTLLTSPSEQSTGGRVVSHEQSQPDETEDMDLLDEFLDEQAVDHVQRHLIEPEETVRRTLMVLLGIGYGILFILNVVFALTLNPTAYASVGAIVGGVQSVVAGFLGAAVAFYFTRRSAE